MEKIAIKDKYEGLMEEQRSDYIKFRDQAN